MTKFLEKNKTFIGIITLALIVGGAIYFSKVKIKKSLTSSLVSKSEVSSKSCANLPALEDGAKKLVTKVIDGDTFLMEGGYSVRILGVDADERGYPCYEVAKNRLEELILNKEVKLEKGKEDFDQYCRYLRYVFLDEKNISLELVKEGLAVARFSPEDVKYREEISLAEKEARENKLGCKWGSVAKVEGKTEIRWENLTEEKTGLKVIGACQAGNYYGKEVIVEGKVAATFRSKTNTVFLNFEKPYPNQCFSAVIFSSDQFKFVENPEKYYDQKNLRIRGKIQEYQGKPEIILKDPSQIEVGK
jgi:micrococcal nuclease